MGFPPDGDGDSSASPNAGSPAWDDPGVSGSSPHEIDDSRRHGEPIRLPISIPVRPSPVTLPSEPASPTGFTINIAWDSSVDSAPSGFTSDILAAVNFLETQFTDPVTININVGYQEVAGGSLGNGDLGESLTNLDSVSSASLLNAVTADATSAADAGVVAEFAATHPVSNGNYWVSTAGAASFGLNPTGNGAVLTTGAHGVTGSSGGTLYALTMTATDQTATANPSVADPMNVVAGDNGNAVIELSSLPGIVTAAPTFIYGLGGIDTIDGTGMTGSLYFDGGTGADTLTGGGGANVYDHGGAVDSTGSAMDIVTNFNVALDLIDPTGISSPFGTVQALDPTATKIAAGWIGWQTTGGNTFVYVNTSNRTEMLSGANMKIELQGTVALTTANFTHS